MGWERVARFFTLEAVATYIVALFMLAPWIYRKWKSRQGRHVVCAQTEPEFSHLYLSERAREWVQVKYIGDNQQEPSEIATLSQVVIDIENDSNTDTLNDVKLKFRVPGARVLRVWWEEAPDYVQEHSELVSSPEDDSSAVPPWTVEVSLPDLKSFKKYREVFRIGILADGDLKSIEMLPQGSRGGVSPDQVWTAKFYSFAEFRKKQLQRGAYISVAGRLVLILVAFSLLLFLTPIGTPILYLSMDWTSFIVGLLFATVLGILSRMISATWARTVSLYSLLRTQHSYRIRSD
jgi:hypothetical protein